MPAWRDRLSAREVDHLVAWVKAVSDFDPLPAEAAAGRDVAASLGCFACHGPQGRGDTPNPGSLKGHIPSWSGADFLALARDEGEIHEWIREGAPRRLRENPWRRSSCGARLSDARLRGTRRRSGDPPDHHLHPLAEAWPALTGELRRVAGDADRWRAAASVLHRTR
jgi:hypothetical protein